MDQDPERRVTFDAGLEATMVNMRFVHLARQRFEELEKVAVKMHGRHMAVTLDGGLRLRFKKFDDKLRSGNVKTNRQREIYHQYEIEGIESPTDVTFGYATNPAGTNISGVYVTCPVGWRENAWMIAVRDPGLEDGYQLFGGGDDSPNDDEIIVVPKTGKAKSRDASA